MAGAVAEATVELVKALKKGNKGPWFVLSLIDTLHRGFEEEMEAKAKAKAKAEASQGDGNHPNHCDDDDDEEGGEGAPQRQQRETDHRKKNKKKHKQKKKRKGGISSKWQRLLENGKDEESGNTLLHFLCLAAQFGDRERATCVERLLLLSVDNNHNSDVLPKVLRDLPQQLHARNKRDESPISAVVARGDLATLRVILLYLPKGEAINQKDSRGDTVLHIAVKQNHFSLLQELLSHPDVDTSIINKAGRTPFALAKFMEDKQNNTRAPSPSSASTTSLVRLLEQHQTKKQQQQKVSNMDNRNGSNVITHNSSSSSVAPSSAPSSTSPRGASPPPVPSKELKHQVPPPSSLPTPTKSPSPPPSATHSLTAASSPGFALSRPTRATITNNRKRVEHEDDDEDLFFFTSSSATSSLTADRRTSIEEQAFLFGGKGGGCIGDRVPSLEQKCLECLVSAVTEQHQQHEEEAFQSLISLLKESIRKKKKQQQKQQQQKQQQQKQNVRLEEKKNTKVKTKKEGNNKKKEKGKERKGRDEWWRRWGTGKKDEKRANYIRKLSFSSLAKRPEENKVNAEVYKVEEEVEEEEEMDEKEQEEAIAPLLQALEEARLLRKHTRVAKKVGKELSFKIVLLGEEGVGKTSLCYMLRDGVFPMRVPPANCALFWHKTMLIDKHRVTLDLWDTAGEQRFDSMSAMYYRGMDAAVVLYKPFQASSWQRCRFWVEHVKKHCPPETVIFLVATQVDTLAESVLSSASSLAVPHSIAQQYVRENKLQNWVAVSSVADFNVDHLFISLARCLAHRTKLSAVQSYINSQLVPKTHSAPTVSFEEAAIAAATSSGEIDTTSPSPPLSSNSLSPMWQPDTATSCCNQCKNYFTLLRRRHHCRRCGLLYCGECSSKYSSIPELGVSDLVRVCDSCFALLAASSPVGVVTSLSEDDFVRTL